MPNHDQCGETEFAYYETMSTEELQKILREDASKPVGEESNSQALFYIMEVLAKRRKERNEGKSPAEALDSFKNNYYNETELSSYSDNAVVTRKRIRTGSWRRGLVAAVAAICILVVGNSITASALDFDLWEIIAKWTQETFHFGYAGEIRETNAPNPEYSNPFVSLQEALVKQNMPAEIMPTWIPNGYQEGEIKIFETPNQRQIFANYPNGDSCLRVSITEYMDAHPVQSEQSDLLIEIYIIDGVDYHIFSNYEQLKVVWIYSNYECAISGPLSITEIKEMIDSIGKE